MTANRQTSRPPLEDIDLSDMTASVIRPDPKEVERRREFASTLEQPAFIDQSTGAGVVKVVRSRSQTRTPPGSATTQAVVPSASPPSNSQKSDGEGPALAAGRRPRAEEPNLTVRLPDYLQQAVRMRAVSERTTVRLIILRALRGAGFEIHEQDMTDDRGIVAKMRRRGTPN